MLTLTPPSDSHHDSLYLDGHKRFAYTEPDGHATRSFFSRTASPRIMSTSHRGLPPPAAMTLPDPTRGPMHMSQALNQLPHGGPTSSSWHNSDESSHDRLVARVEEDRRKQEEEKTRQEELRLEQRRIEQNMLHESIHGGVPPHLIPVIFAGMAGGPLAQAGFEMAQTFLNQIQQSMQQQQQETQVSPEQRNDARMGSSHGPYYSAPQGSHQNMAQTGPGQALAAQGQHATSVYPSPAHHSPKRQSKTLYAAPAQYGNHAYAPRDSTLPALPRLTTNEPVTAAPSSYSQQQTQTHTSPSIYFHHWQPPPVSKESSGKDSQKTSPNLPSHVSRSNEHSNSPRKRKATGPHQPAPMPSTASPSFSATSTSSNKSRHRPGHDRSKHRSRSSYDPIRSSRANSIRREDSSGEHSKVEDDSRSRQATPPSNGRDEAMPDRPIKSDEPPS
ncbi:MAG: hypothetical protein M1828_003274 [Chrysothrix sp. TS-e1954]|nr:MAG: hypothetical protein M1828_003274 [Chrysothrix sp. TS-e1954]